MLILRWSIEIQFTIRTLVSPQSTRQETIDLTSSSVDWDANGFRLPTEAGSGRSHLVAVLKENFIHGVMISTVLK